MSILFRRIEHLTEQHAMLPWLLGDLPLAEQAVHRQVLEQSMDDASQREQLFFWAAYRDEEVQAVVLAQIQVGKTALLWPPRVIRKASHEWQETVLRSCLQQLQQMGIVVLQALLLPSAQADHTLLTHAGFYNAAELLYMTAERISFPAQLPFPALEWENVSPNDERLRDLVSASYHGSLDCPVIDGWRAIDDVLAGYQATGTYRADLWWLLQQGQQATGCIIVADYPHMAQWELVYLGVHPRSRGQGLGEQMVLWLQHQALIQNVERIILAVDAANHPALAIYRDCGFVEFDRRLALAMKL
jgi:ribosomal protein S18 acetylase RimI-like enzyme